MPLVRIVPQPCSETTVVDSLLPSVRQRLSYNDCLEDKREDYQNCSVLYSVAQLCTIIYTLI